MGFFKEYGGAFYSPVLEAEMEKNHGRLLFPSANLITLFRNSEAFATLPRCPTPFIIANRLFRKIREEYICNEKTLIIRFAHKLKPLYGEALLAKHLGKKKTNCGNWRLDSTV